MKRFPVNPELLSGTIPMNCRERLLLFLIQAEKLPVAPLYSGSYMTFSAITEAVCEDGLRDETFTGFGDLFQEAVNEELIKVKRFDGVPPSEIVCDGYLMVGVKEAFVKERCPSVHLNYGYAILVMKNGAGNYEYVFGKGVHFGTLTPEELDRCSDGTAEEIIVGRGYRRLRFEYVDRFYELLEYDTPHLGEWKYSADDLRYVMALVLLSRRRVVALLEYGKYDVKEMCFQLRSLTRLYHELEHVDDKDIDELTRVRAFAMSADDLLTKLIVREVDK